MKNIRNYDADKYSASDSKRNLYKIAEEGIYETETGGSKFFVTSLSFEQEPNCGEGSSAADISQYPLEDILDKYLCHVSDFYEDKNTAKSQVCYLEFASVNIEDIKRLREIIGKHVYNSETENGERIDSALIIE